MYFRELRFSDLKYLYRLVHNLWDFPSFCVHKKNALFFTASATSDLLANSNYSLIACNDQDQPMGFLLSRLNLSDQAIKATHALRHSTKALERLEKLKLTEPEATTEYFRLKAAFSSLKNKIPLEKQVSEIVWFATAENYQGQGIGSSLLQEYILSCKKLKITELYLLTDEQCNYRYYDHHDFLLIDQIAEELKLQKLQQSNKIFLYHRKI